MGKIMGWRLHGETPCRDLIADLQNIEPGRAG
jgi:hypothetical protein